MAVYVVKYSDYDYWENYGYFTDRHEAEKYCIAHPEKELDIEEIPCFDNKEDLSNVKVMYKYSIIFRKEKDFSWSCSENGDPRLYSEKHLRNNSIESYDCGSWVCVWVNSKSDDIELVKKIAQDIFYQYLDSCDGIPSIKTAIEFNKILSVAENERKEKERLDKIREEELKELERLKLKYENND